MQLCDINPFMRYAAFQSSALSNVPFSRAYDYRLFYVVEGSAKFIYNGDTFDVDQGTLIYFRPGEPYYFDGKIKVLVLNFDMTRAQSHRKRPLDPTKYINTFDASLIFENDPPEELSGLIIAKNCFSAEDKLKKCLLYYSSPTSLSDAASSAIIKDLLCFIIQKADGESNNIPRAVRKALLYIQQNYDKDITNSQIANAVGYHSYYLNRVFKCSTGITMHQALIREKMNVAKYILKATNLPINAVAAEVGFPVGARFCSAFRKYTGLTPTEYRKSKTTI